MSLRRQRGRWLVMAAIMAGGLLSAGVGPAASAAAPQLTAARPVPGLDALNAGGTARVTSVSCATAGNCAAVGSYTDASGNLLPFVADEKNGTWGNARGLALETRATNVQAEVLSVSCASAANCSAVGYSGAAQRVPGLDAMTGGSPSEVHSIACASAGNCVLAGDYTDAQFFEQAFLGNETGRIWRTAQAVPGIIAINTAIAQTQAVSCVPGGKCTAAGIYSGQGGSFHAWVIAQAAG